MAQLWTCPNGHAWSSSEQPDTCPVCGVALPAEVGGPAAVNAPTLTDQTLFPGAPTGGAPRPSEALLRADLDLPWEPLETLAPNDMARGAPLTNPSAGIEPTLVPPATPTDSADPIFGPATLIPSSADSSPSWPVHRAVPSGGVDYEILGLLGRGGMGVVYKARQIKLNRTVALKMILGGTHASAEDLARFRFEASAVAQLRHDNIVQVYDVGERDGMPFFSLEFLEGGSLQARMDGKRWEAAEAARLVETLARAVQFAHQAGIIHRDLKPANILLTADGVPKITDFGLAKSLQDDSGRTGTEAILGTPAYMAPEQASGRTRLVGPPADVYALGAILYDLLTGGPPFQGSTIVDTLQMVQHAEPTPPRQHVPSLSRDLETICLKCLQKDPARRYNSALDLADDLERFQAGHPIQARPTPTWERILMWARRRPADAILVAVGAVAVVAFLVLGWVFNARLSVANTNLRQTVEQRDEANDQLVKEKEALRLAVIDVQKQYKRAEEEKTRAETEKTRAESEKTRAQAQEQDAARSFAQLQRAVASLVRLSQQRLRNQANTEDVRQQLLQDALRMCEFFLSKDNGKTPFFISRTARVQRLIGELQEALGHRTEAAARYRSAIDLLTELLERPDGKAGEDYLADLLETHVSLWGVLEGLDPRAAGRVLEEALQLARQPLPEGADPQRHRATRAALLTDQGIHHQNRLHYDRAESAYLAAEKELERLKGRELELARVRVNLGALWTAAPPGSLPAAGALRRDPRTKLEQAIAELDRRVKDHPLEAGPADELGRAYSNLAVLLSQRKGGALATRTYRLAVKRFRELATASPQRVDYRHQLAVALGNLGVHLLHEQDQSGDADTLLAEARRLLEELAQSRNRDSQAYRHDLVRVLNGQGVSLLASGQAARAREPLESAWKQARQLRASSPDRDQQALAPVRQNLLVCHDALARLALAGKDWETATRSMGWLVKLRRERAEDLASHKASPGQPVAWLAWAARLLLARAELARTLRSQAVLLADRGDHRGAAGAARELCDLVSPRWEEYPDCAALLARCMALARGDREAALAYGRDLLERLNRAADRGSPTLAERLKQDDFAPLRDNPALQAEYRRLAARLRTGARKQP
jgi:serine/threonine protein kinase